MYVTGMRLTFHQKSASSEFTVNNVKISDSQHFYILLQMNRSPSQISVELWILKIGLVILVWFSIFKVLQKAGNKIYIFLVKYKSFENPEFRKIHCFRMLDETSVSCLLLSFPTPSLACKRFFFFHFLSFSLFY